MENMKEVRDLIHKQELECDERYVLEKVYWQRTVRVLVVAITLFTGLLGSMIGLSFKWSNEVTNNTQGRRELERRINVVERQNSVILENHDDLAENQKNVLYHQERLGKKLDILIDRSGRR